MLNVQRVVEEAIEPITDFINVVSFRPKKEEWATLNEVVLDYQTLKLRYFTGPRQKKTVVILPPQAGHAGTLTDYQEKQSLVRLFQAKGYNVFVTDWQPATEEYRNMGIYDYIRLTDMAVNRANKISKTKKVLMVGQCQGGWQAAIYASLFQEKISGLIIAAAPIDLWAEISFFSNCAQAPQNVFNFTVNANNGVMPGQLMLNGFKSLQPHEHYFWKYIKLFIWSLQRNEKELKRHIRFTNWYETTQNLPGKFYLEAVEYIFRQNCLTKPGSLILDGRGVDLRSIKCPLVLIGGKKDDITPPQQVFAMKKLVSSKRVLEILALGGHIGTLMSNDSLNNNWPVAIDFFDKKLH